MHQTPTQAAPTKVGKGVNKGEHQEQDPSQNGLEPKWLRISWASPGAPLGHRSQKWKPRALQDARKGAQRDRWTHGHACSGRMSEANRIAHVS